MSGQPARLRKAERIARSQHRNYQLCSTNIVISRKKSGNSDPIANVVAVQA